MIKLGFQVISPAKREASLRDVWSTAPVSMSSVQVGKGNNRSCYDQSTAAHIDGIIHRRESGCRLELTILLHTWNDDYHGRERPQKCIENLKLNMVNKWHTNGQ